MSNGAPSSPPDARARDLEIYSTTDERVRCIALMMAKGEWSTRASSHALASEWGVSVSRIRDYAAEASRRNRQATDAAEIAELREATIGRLERLSAKAEQESELRTAVKAEETKARVAGLVSSDVKRDLVVIIGGDEMRVSVDAAKTLLDQIGRAILDAPADMLMGEWRSRVLPEALKG